MIKCSKPIRFLFAADIQNFSSFDDTVATSDENIDPVVLMNELLEKETETDANASLNATRKRPGGRVARVRIATATGRCGFESHLNRTFVEDCDWWNFFGLQLHPQRSSMATPSCLHGAASTMDALVLAILAFFVYGWLCSPSVCGFSLLLASL